MLSASIHIALLAAAADLQTRVAPCGDDYVQAQLDRQGGHLLAAREALERCSAEKCPAALARDCRKWREEVDAALPSVVFQAKDASGAQAMHVTVRMDGRVVAEELDGRAIALDPGRHHFTFVLDPLGERQSDVVVLEGVKAQKVEVSFESPKPSVTTAPEPPPLLVLPPARHTERPIPAGTWVFGGMALAATVGVVVFGTWALVSENDLRSSCAPFCLTSARDDIRTRQIVADASLLGGFVAAAVAIVFYLTRPTVVSAGRAR